MIRSNTRQRPSPAGSRYGAFLLTAVLLGGAAAGCGAVPERGGAAATLQSQVLAVTKAAAANDPAGTLKLLDELVTKLDRAAAAGEISFQRHQSIMATIDALRAAFAETAAAAVTPSPQAPIETAEAPLVAIEPAEQPAVAVVPAAPVAVVPAPVKMATDPVPANSGKAVRKDNGEDDSDDRGKGNEGRGRGDDNRGKGRDKDDD